MWEQCLLSSGVHQITTLKPCEHAGLGPFTTSCGAACWKWECNMNQLQDLTLRYCTQFHGCTGTDVHLLFVSAYAWKALCKKLSLSLCLRYFFMCSKLIWAQETVQFGKEHSQVYPTWLQLQGEQSWFVLTPLSLPNCNKLDTCGSVWLLFSSLKLVCVKQDDSNRKMHQSKLFQIQNQLKVCSQAWWPWWHQSFLTLLQTE